jgi:excisionase family DNA binding protein
MHTATTSSTPRQRRPDPLETPLLLSVPRAARLLGIGVTFAWELVHAGAIPSVRLGRRVLVPRTALEQAVGAKRAEESTS